MMASDTYEGKKVCEKNYLTYEQQMCRSYEYQLRMFSYQLKLGL